MESTFTGIWIVICGRTLSETADCAWVEPAVAVTVNGTAPANLGTANPIAVKFLNLDSAPHCIHASNATQGFPHDSVTNGVCNTPMQTNQLDQTAHNVNAKGSYLFWLHDQGDLTDGMINIQ